MNQLLSDMWDTLRLRYRPFETYQFPAWIYVLALVLCGISMAAVMQSNANAQPEYALPFINQTGMVVYYVLFVVGQWWCLSYVLPKILKQFGAEVPNLWGYMLVTQAFTMFTILYSYLPKELMVISSFFGLWTFWVQIFGLFNVVGRLISPWKVLLSYVLSLLSFLVVLMLISSIFMIAGQMDTKELETKMQQIMQEQQQLQQQPSK
jgi:hypothetical protein